MTFLNEANNIKERKVSLKIFLIKGLKICSFFFFTKMHEKCNFARMRPFFKLAQDVRKYIKCREEKKP